MENFEQVIYETILEVAQEVNPSILNIENANTLNADLGLKSLDLARIVAMLEINLSADPFAALVAITSIRTVGDLVKAYKRFFNNEEPEETHELEESQRRANARQEAITNARRARTAE